MERTRDEVAWAIREYLVPRLDDPLAPAVAVVAGPGGTGKSAILNAMARRPVSESGVMRPTTTEPIVWGSRSRPESDWRVFLHRLREQTGAELDVVMGDDPLTEHVIFVDTPPVDLARVDGRIPALEALGLADICIFVTSASRYADASGWMYLEAARRRGVPILHVINRLPRDPDAAEEVLIDYVARLHGRDLLIEPEPRWSSRSSPQKSTPPLGAQPPEQSEPCVASWRNLPTRISAARSSIKLSWPPPSRRPACPPGRCRVGRGGARARRVRRSGGGRLSPAEQRPRGRPRGRPLRRVGNCRVMGARGRRPHRDRYPTGRCRRPGHDTELGGTPGRARPPRLRRRWPAPPRPGHRI